ncbi:MAG TPA: ribonuclease E/G [Caulobacteraceae bacterium]
MTERRLYLDVGVGESRGVVTLDGRPERLIIERDGDLARQRLGARCIGRVRRVERASALAFIDLGEGPDAVLNLSPADGRLVEGAAVEIDIRSQARGEKGATARLVGPADGSPRLVTPGPGLEDQLRAFAQTVEVRTGGVARSMADSAQEEALATVFDLPGGGSVAIETTRALTAVDVDLGGRQGGDAKRAARAANFAALSMAARVLRLKGLGGLIVVDLVGRGHDGPALLSGARGAFGPDNPGVAIAPISRFGTIELTVPRRARPTIDILTDGAAAASDRTLALALIRSIERQAASDPGARFEAFAAPQIAAAAQPYMECLLGRLGARVTLTADPDRDRSQAEVAHR